MKRRDFCKVLVCSAALAPGLALPRAEAAAKSQTVGRAVPAGNYTMSFRSELSQMDIEHEYYYSDSFFAHASIQYDHQLALATLGMVTAAFNTWASDAKYWANGDVGRENSLDAAYTKLGFGDVKYRYYDVDVGKAGDFVGWSTARKTITLNGKRTTIVALVLRGGGYGGEWVSNLHTGVGTGHAGFVIATGEVLAHLRSYLENVKAPFENAMDSSVYTAFAHNIRLVDGVYLQESVSSYADVINALTEGGGIHTYTAVDGDTVESVVNATGVSFDSLAQMNPELLTLDQEIPAGTVITTGASSAELIKVKVVRRDTETVAIPFDTQNTESDQYDFGKVVTLQEGADGSEEITYETTMIDGAVTDRQAVAYNVLQAPTPEITVTGTKLKNGMIAKVGSGSFIWPVPNYKYVSRWMGNGHRGADICAAYGTPILASDSGTIIAAGWHYSYGNYVEIDHGNGYKTLYGHMSSIAVSQGQAVTQGQVIGYVGSTGNSTGNHCHFEMSYNGALFSAYTLFSGM